MAKDGRGRGTRWRGLLALLVLAALAALGAYQLWWSYGHLGQITVIVRPGQ